MEQKQRIPRRLIGILGDIFSDLYTHADIDRIFNYAEAPGDIPAGNKVKKTITWLETVNKNCDSPNQVLGSLLEDLMERGIDYRDEIIATADNDDWRYRFIRAREKVSAELLRAGLCYSEGGRLFVLTDEVVSKPLVNLVQEEGHQAISQEINRALKMLDSDPDAAAHYAANVLEATFKAYLNTKLIEFDDASIGLVELWKMVRDDLGINPENLDSKDLKKIASGLNNIVDGTMHVRNKKSGAHGKSEERFHKVRLRPRHARLVVNSSNTIAIYVLECLRDR